MLMGCVEERITIMEGCQVNNGIFWEKGIKLVTGCTPVSPGCKNCWSEKMEARFHTNPCYAGLTEGGKFNGRVRFNWHLLRRGIRIKEPTVFAIWNDFYHLGVTDYDRDLAIEYMYEAKRHTWLIVTKRPALAALFHANHPVEKPQSFPDNIWHIITVENLDMADKRIPYALKIPGKRGLLIEPMLGPVDLERHLDRVRCKKCPWTGTPEEATVPTGGDDYEGMCPLCFAGEDDLENYLDGDLIHTVICGGETGTGARPINPDWARSVRDQCRAAGVPFFFKAWGSYKGPYDWKIPAGRLLDGVEHNDLAWKV